MARARRRVQGPADYGAALHPAAAARRQAQAAAGESMCLRLELDAEHAKTSPLRGLVGNTTTEDEDG